MRDYEIRADRTSLWPLNPNLIQKTWELLVGRARISGLIPESYLCAREKKNMNHEGSTPGFSRATLGTGAYVYIYIYMNTRESARARRAASETFNLARHKNHLSRR